MTRPNAPTDTRASAERRRKRVEAFGDWFTQPHQDRLWRYLSDGGKRACAVWHRRAGKDDVALHWTCQAAHQRIGNYWHMLPQAEQARKAIWDAVNPHTGRKRIDEAFPPDLRRRTRNNEMMIELKKGSIWQVVGSDNYNALVGSPPLGVVLSEWSLADPAAWAYLSPILRENGGWAVFLYTPRGRNHGLSTYRVAKSSANWFCERLPATDTDVFTPEELAEELREKRQEFGPDLGQAYFDQEYICSFDAAVIGSIYAAQVRKAEREGRVGVVPVAPGYPINTAWDLGYQDPTAIWFWQLTPGPELRIVDFYQATGQMPQHYAEVLYGRRIKIDERGHMVLGEEIVEHAHRRQYKYGRHYAPHDAAHHTLAAGGRSFGDQMFGFGISLDVLDAVNQMDGIHAARRTLDYCWFDQRRCADGISALESYHFEWDEKTRTLKTTPKHDWSSHPCDAFEIIGQAWQAPRAKPKSAEPRFLHQATADELFWPKDSIGKRGRNERL